MVKMNKETEYEKDLSKMKKQILKEGNTLLTKKDLLERFCEIDKEYNGQPWNLLQILANINILIGEEPCEDCISRAQTLSDYADWYGYGYRDNTFYKILKNMPSVQPKYNASEWCHDCSEYDQNKHCCPRFNRVIHNAVEEVKKPKMGHWITKPHVYGVTYCSECDFELKIDNTNYCPNCGAKMVEPQESEALLK